MVVYYDSEIGRMRKKGKMLFIDVNTETRMDNDPKETNRTTPDKNLAL